MADEIPAAPVAAAPAVAPAVQPADAPAIPGFRFGATHLASLMGAGYAGNELTKPLIHWAVTGGAPDADAQSAMATIASLIVAGVVIWFTRGRAGIAAILTGDSSNAS